MKNRIMVVGDVHGDWPTLNALINRQSPNIILQCGDWGFWPKYDGLRVRHFGKELIWTSFGAKNPDTDIYWCDGNHEDHWSLKTLTDKQVQPGVFYMKRGSTLLLADGRTVLFMGGAHSIDKDQRTLGDDWFPDEVITQKDVMDLPDTTVDIVISHTCPEEFYKFDNMHYDNDPSRAALSYILETYRPSLWYFGHFHQYKTGYTSRCRWTALNTSRSTNWWKWLE